MTQADNDALVRELNNLPMVCKGSQFDGWLLSNPTLESILAALRTPQPDETETLRAEVEMLKRRGAAAVIAYHVAICSPKGVVPVDDLYDPVIAARVEQDMDRARQALKGTDHG